MVMHKIKNIYFLGRNISIVLQNENGPCPLLSLVNVLLLRGTLEIPTPCTDEIDSNALIQLIANHLIESNPPSETEAIRANQQKALEDTIDMLPTLQFGLDVNVKFRDVTEFEFTSGTTLFDMLNVSLYHGWVVDPQDVATSHLTSDLSFNQLVEKVVTKQDTIDRLLGKGEGNGNKNQDQDDPLNTSAKSDQLDTSADSEKEASQVALDAILAKQFLETSASQLTYYGLLRLHQQVHERELCVFFRNNHFATMFKLDGDLYLLQTDQGYQQSSNVAWEHLAEIDGNTELVSPDFGDVNHYLSPEDLELHDKPLHDPDMLLALQLQEEESRRASNAALRSSQRSLRSERAGERLPGSTSTSEEGVHLRGDVRLALFFSIFLLKYRKRSLWQDLHQVLEAVHQGDPLIVIQPPCRRPRAVAAQRSLWQDLHQGLEAVHQGKPLILIQPPCRRPRAVAAQRSLRSLWKDLHQVLEAVHQGAPLIVIRCHGQPPAAVM